MTTLKEYKGTGDPADAANWETIIVGGPGPAGPPGAPGPTGSPGSNGVAGPPPPTISLTRAQWQALSPPDPATIYIITDEGGVLLSGTTAPAAGLGYNGDFYLDSVAWLIYGPKTTGGWGAGTSIRGPQGPASTVPGPQGPTGPTGAAGDWSTAQTIEAVAGATYTVVAADAGKLKSMTVTATVTLPSAGPTPGQRVDFVSVGGPTTFVLGGGATWHVTPTPSAVARSAGSMITAVKMGATTWALTGDLS